MAADPDDVRTHPITGRAALLVADPDLALGVPPDERALAVRAVVVPLVEASPGPLELHEVPSEPSLGVLVLEGFVRSVTAFAGQSSDQLLGPGHVVLTGDDGDDLLPVFRAHEALTTVQFAILDRRFIAAVRRWPGLLLALHERLRLQQRQLAVHAAIGRLRRNEDRILAVLWQIAEQWGHVTPQGVVIPVRMTHDALGRLAGASRPTTSLALAALEAEGRLRRSAGAQLVLDPDSSMILERALSRAPTRARSGPAGGTPVRPRIDRDALLARVAALHGAFDDHVRSHDEILEAARASTARSLETRRQLQAARDRRS